MDCTLILPGIVLSILLVVLLYKRTGLPPIKFKKFRIDTKKLDKFIVNTMFIVFFCMVFVGIKGFDWRIASIICGIAGLWFCYPRGGEGR